MKRVALCCLLATVVGTVMSANGETAGARPHAGRLGGMVVRPGTRHGKIVIGNAQTKAPVAAIERAVADFKRIFDPEIEVKPVQKPTVADAEKAVESADGEVALFLVEDAALPSLISAPESGLVMINVSPLAEGVDEAVFAKRIRIEVVRALALLAGAHSSAYATTLMGAVKSPSDLDAMDENATLPVDVASRFMDYLKAWGVTQGLKVQYRQAVREGWAPAPTNDVQKAIWDKVHEMPSEPIKIKPETTKQK